MYLLQFSKVTGCVEYVCVCYLTDRLLQVVSPDVDVVQSFVHCHSFSQSQQTLRPDAVTADRQPDRQTETVFVCLM